MTWKVSKDRQCRKEVGREVGKWRRKVGEGYEELRSLEKSTGSSKYLGRKVWSTTNWLVTQVTVEARIVARDLWTAMGEQGDSSPLNVNEHNSGIQSVAKAEEMEAEAVIWIMLLAKEKTETYRKYKTRYQKGGMVCRWDMFCLLRGGMHL